MRDRFASVGTIAAVCVLAASVTIHAILSFGAASINESVFHKVVTVLGSSDAPAWVQALGSAGAIFWGVWFWRADRRQRQEDSLVVAELAAGRLLALTTTLQVEAAQAGGTFARMRRSGSPPYEFARALKRLDALAKPTDTQLLQLVPIGRLIAHNLVNGIVLMEQARIHLQGVAERIQLRPMPEEDRKVHADSAAAMLLPAARQFEFAVAGMEKFLRSRTGVAPMNIEISGF